MGAGDPVRVSLVRESRRERLFYSVFLPLGVVANIGLGLLILMRLNPVNWSDWLTVAIGALCCAIGGWLAAAAWSKSYWHRSIAQQVAVWRRIADAFFAWVEEAPVPAESLKSLKSTLEEVVPSSRRN